MVWANTVSVCIALVLTYPYTYVLPQIQIVNKYREIKVQPVFLSLWYFCPAELDGSTYSLTSVHAWITSCGSTLILRTNDFRRRSAMFCPSEWYIAASSFNVALPAKLHTPDKPERLVATARRTAVAIARPQCGCTAAQIPRTATANVPVPCKAAYKFAAALKLFLAFNYSVTLSARLSASFSSSCRGWICSTCIWPACACSTKRVKTISANCKARQQGNCLGLPASDGTCTVWLSS